MSSPKSVPLRAERRERKKKIKMVIHGKGVKTQPSYGIPRCARRVKRSRILAGPSRSV
ncbi:hypothetical protein HYW17_04720 [Candidatus Uhrbacteria bacterium]|nr:hypothetical protein [Candidatus Uhrbacteria bacterium]